MGTQRVALGDAVVGTVLGDEALGDEALLALGKTFGLGDEGFEAGDFGGVGSTLDLEVGGVQFGEALALLDAVAGVGRDGGDAAGHFGADFRIDQRLQGAERVFGDIQRNALGLGDGDQCGRRAGRFGGGTVGFAATAGKTEGEDQGNAGGETHGRSLRTGGGGVTEADVRP